MLFRSGNWCWVVLVRVCLLSGATNESCNSDAKRVHSIVYSSFSSLLLHIFFFMSSSSVREKENLKMHWLYLLWVCSTQVCLTMRFWVFPIFKELPTFYPIYSIFQEFYCFFPLFHFPSFLEYNMKTVNAPCWTRFNLIFLINSNSFKYMHQQ